MKGDLQRGSHWRIEEEGRQENQHPLRSGLKYDLYIAYKITYIHSSYVPSKVVTVAAYHLGYCQRKGWALEARRQIACCGEHERRWHRWSREVLHAESWERWGQQWDHHKCRSFGAHSKHKLWNSRSSAAQNNLPCRKEETKKQRYEKRVQYRIIAYTTVHEPVRYPPVSYNNTSLQNHEISNINSETQLVWYTNVPLQW